MTDEDQRQAQMDSMGQDIASRILKDINRKTRVIILIPGSASATTQYPKIDLAANDDLLRVADQLLRHGLSLVQTRGVMLPVLDQFSQLIESRIYTLTDLPDLDIDPTDQLLTNRYEPLSYHDLGIVIEHVEAMNSKPESANLLTFDGAQSHDNSHS